MRLGIAPREPGEGFQPCICEIEVKHVGAGNPFVKQLVDLLEEVEGFTASAHAGDDVDQVEERRFGQGKDDLCSWQGAGEGELE